MKTKVNLTALFLLICIGKCFSQNNPASQSIIPPSPTAASLGKFINNYGNSSTGAINASVPVYSLQSGSLSENISLNYNSGGFKPAEVPGWVGAGWSLNVGGVITRVVRGLPDDTYQYGYLNRVADAQTVDNDIRTEQPIAQATWDQLDNNQLDVVPDLYNFHFGKYSGQFYIDLNGNVRIMPYQNLIITKQLADNPDHNTLDAIDNWTITTPEGDQYTFSDKEWSTEPITQATQPSAINHVASWYLTNVTSLKGDYINYHYQGTPNTYRYQESQSEMFGLFDGNFQVYPTGVLSGYGTIEEQTKATNSYSTNPCWSEVIYLSEIDTKLGSVKFFTSDRNDPFQQQPPGSGYTLKDQQLDSIAVYSSFNTSAPIKSYAIKYNPNYENYRAVPWEFRQYAYGGIIFNKYDFQYYPFPNVPYNSKSIDHWGYYNGIANTSLIPETRVNAPALHINNQFEGSADRDPNTDVAVMGILQKIIYPTGGETDFEYEPHDYSFVGGSSFNRRVPIRVNAGRAIHYYTVGDGDDSDQSFTILYGPTTMTATGVAEINDGRDCTQEEIPVTISKVFYPGTYSVINDIMPDIYNNIDYRKVNCLYRMDITVRGKDTLLTNIQSAGGVRLKKVTNYDGIDHVRDLITTYNYKINYNGTTLSSGSIGADPIYYYYFDGSDLSNAINAFFFMKSSSINDIPLTQGNFINYERIEEARADGSKTVNYYSTYNDYSDDSPDYQEPINNYLGPNTKSDFLRGNLTKTEVYNNQNVLLSETDKSYTTSLSNYFSQYLWTFYPYRVQGFQLPVIEFICGSKERSVWFYMNQQKDILYNSNGSVTTTHDFSYDNTSNILLTRESTTKSDGKRITNLYIYGDQYSPLNTATNGATKPIEQVAIQDDPFGTKVVSGNLYEYGNMSLLTKSYNLTSLSPIDASNFKFSSNPVGQIPYINTLYGAYAPDSRYVQKVMYQYDNVGNISSITPTSGSADGYQWGYKQSYPVAECKNASNTEFYYESFEESTASGLQTNGGHTGHNYINGNYTVAWTPPSGNTRSYVISYWYKNSSTGLWAFQTEQAYTAGMTLSNGTAYDDIRVYPKDAQMTTYTYEPLVGMTSSTDAKGQTTYYEYDSFQRLSNVKDQDGNILKHTDYHYQNQ